MLVGPQAPEEYQSKRGSFFFHAPHTLKERGVLSLEESTRAILAAPEGSHHILDPEPWPGPDDDEIAFEKTCCSIIKAGRAVRPHDRFSVFAFPAFPRSDWLRLNTRVNYFIPSCYANRGGASGAANVARRLIELCREINPRKEIIPVICPLRKQPGVNTPWVCVESEEQDAIIEAIISVQLVANILYWPARGQFGNVVGHTAEEVNDFVLEEFERLENRWRDTSLVQTLQERVGFQGNATLRKILE